MLLLHCIRYNRLLFLVTLNCTSLCFFYHSHQIQWTDVCSSFVLLTSYWRQKICERINFGFNKTMVMSKGLSVICFAANCSDAELTPNWCRKWFKHYAILQGWSYNIIEIIQEILLCKNNTYVGRVDVLKMNRSQKNESMKM